MLRLGTELGSGEASPFRRFLQSSAEIYLFTRTLTDEEVNDLCAELSDPASKLKKLK